MPGSLPHHSRVSRVSSHCQRASRTAATATSIFEHARANLSGYQLVRIIEFVDELPKTISGKIRRVELRQTESGRRERGAKDPLEFFEDDFPDLKT